VPSWEEIEQQVRAGLDHVDSIRERALVESRDIIRQCATAIKHVHRGEFAKARALLDSTGEQVRALREHASGCPFVYAAGFFQDAQKEYAEGELTFALVQGLPVIPPDALGMDVAPYINGLTEAVGELRRHVLDLIRTGHAERGEPVLEAMDEVYYLCVSFDYPDAVSQGLRRRVDSMRGIIERTRGDLTNALRQDKLERAMASLEQKVLGS
jgi:translin